MMRARGVTLTPAAGKAVCPPSPGTFRKAIAVQVRCPPLRSIASQ